MHAITTDWYELKQERGRWVLIVLCGGVGMYERKLTLSEEEERYIGEYGDHFVKKLATDVSKAPGTFGPRVT